MLAGVTLKLLLLAMPDVGSERDFERDDDRDPEVVRRFLHGDTPRDEVSH
jgi:hypothetical protein